MTLDKKKFDWTVPAICGGLAVITFIVFGQTLGFEFVSFDDNQYVYNNPMVARGLTPSGIGWAFTHFYASNWHPLTWLSHMADCQLYGLKPGGHHFTNVLLHAASVIALFLVLRQMTGAVWRCAFVAAVFAIHPLRAESVAWVAERKDVLSGLFFMLILGAYVRYVRQSSSWSRYGLVMLLFALGLMSKPMLITIPLVLLLLDYWPLQRKEPWRRLFLEKLPFLALAGGSAVVTLFAQHDAITSGGAFSEANRLSNALSAVVIYLWQMAWPVGLGAFYPFPKAPQPLWELALEAALVAGLSALAWLQRRRQPWLLAGWLWYLIMLLPVLGLIQAGTQAHADRYTYLPQIGICLAGTWLVAQWQFGRAAMGVLMSAAVALLMVCAWQQTAIWQNSESLWTATLAAIPNNFFAENSLGNVLLRDGRLDGAVNYFKQAIRLAPAFPYAHANLASALLQLGKVDEAIPEYRLVTKLVPDDAEAHGNLGNALSRQGQLDEAMAEFREGLQINPSQATLHNNLGAVLLRKGNLDEAIAEFQQARQIAPHDVEALNNLAWLLATCAQASLRDGAQALQLAQRANDLTGGTNAVVLGTLAAAFAEVKQFPQAVETAQRALRLAGTESNAGLAERLRSQLKIFQSGRPL